MKALTKLVNGVRINLTQKESAKIEAEWAIEAAKPEPPPSRNSLEEIDDLKARIIKLEKLL